MENEGSLFKYLHGSITFNEWLDHQNTNNVDLVHEKTGNVDFVEGLLGKTPHYTGQSATEDTVSEENSESMNNKTYEPLSTSDADTDDNECIDDSVDFTGQRAPIVISRRVAGMSSSLEESKRTYFQVPLYSEMDSPGSPRSQISKIHKLIKNLSLVLQQCSTAGTAGNSVMKSFQELSQPKVKRLGKSGPSSYKLREDLRQQMGIANLYLAKGQIEQAVNICMEIIRQAPHNPHAFKTLSVIYEEKGDTEKALQFALISAFIGCRDAFEWRDLAQRCLQSGHRKQAMLCYSKGCKLAPKNIVLLWERAALFFENTDYRKCMECYHSIFKLVCDCNAEHVREQVMEMAKEMAQIHHDNEQYEKAIDILEYVFAKFSQVIDSEGLNILAELHLSLKNFERALQVICSYTGVKIPGILNVGSELETGEKDSEDTLVDKDLCAQSKTKNGIEVSWNENTTSSATLEFSQTDLTSVPSSWTEFLLSPRKGPRDNSLSLDTTSQKTFIDLDFHKKTHDLVSEVSAVHEDEEWVIPDALPIDIRVKIVICLIQLNKRCNVEHILFRLRKENVEDVGDLYLDVAEAYMDVGKSEEAIPYLETLVKVDKYCMAAVWLKLAECRNSAGYTDDAVDAYYEVLKLAPDQLSVRLELSNLCRTLGRNEEAVAVLSEQNDTKEVYFDKDIVPEITRKEDFVLWYQKCTILHGQGEASILAESGYIFFVNYFRSAAISRDDGLSKAIVWEMLIKVLQAMVSSGSSVWAHDIIEKALMFRPYCDNKRYRLELDFVGASVYLLTKDYSKAFDMFRWALIRSEKRCLQKAAMWNFFARIVNNMQDRKYHKYVLRLLFKQPAILPLIITNGHNAFLCGSYKCALGEYIRAFRIKPLEPMLSLCIGNTYLHLACQRFSKHRHTSVLQGISFMLQYYQMRQMNQEACYNLARAFHQIGLVHISVIFYERVLEFCSCSSGNSPTELEYDSFDCLHREAAYNLALIYKNSGNMDLARRTLYKYLWL